jgi:hypothetical protein
LQRWRPRNRFQTPTSNSAHGVYPEVGPAEYECAFAGLLALASRFYVRLARLIRHSIRRVGNAGEHFDVIAIAAMGCARVPNPSRGRRSALRG